MYYSWWEMLIVGEVIHELEQGLYGKFLPFTQFCYETKTALKNKAYQNSWEHSSRNMYWSIKNKFSDFYYVLTCTCCLSTDEQYYCKQIFVSFCLKV